MLKNIKAGFAICGLFLFNPDKVLRSMPVPLAKPAISSADEIIVGSRWQDIDLQILETPVTPVLAKALILL